MAVDLDLMPWAPRAFMIRGATGTEYKLEEWMPADAGLRYLQRWASLKDIGADPEAAQTEGDIFLSEARAIAIAVVRHSIPDVTDEQFAADFPGSSAVTLVGFLFSRLSRAQQAREAATKAAMGLVEIPTPNSSSSDEDLVPENTSCSSPSSSPGPD